MVSETESLSFLRLTVIEIFLFHWNIHYLDFPRMHRWNPWVWAVRYILLFCNSINCKNTYKITLKNNSRKITKKITIFPFSHKGLNQILTVEKKKRQKHCKKINVKKKRNNSSDMEDNRIFHLQEICKINKWYQKNISHKNYTVILLINSYVLMRNLVTGNLIISILILSGSRCLLVPKFVFMFNWFTS